MCGQNTAYDRRDGNMRTTSIDQCQFFTIERRRPDSVIIPGNQEGQEAIFFYHHIELRWLYRVKMSMETINNTWW